MNPDEPTFPALLRWYLEAGVDETIGEHPVDRYRLPTAPDVVRGPLPSERPAPPITVASPSLAVSAAPPSATPARGAVESAVSLASHASTLEELKDALQTFDACPLRKTATNLVFGDGPADARIVLIGEAPGAEEDRQGVPFVGPSGRLLDRMLASVGLHRRDVFISNTVFWRPPGNRSPTSAEIATCMPYVERMIELIRPELLIALGGPAATALLGQKESVGKLRGRWFAYQTPRLSRLIPATALFHPAYLLRSPGQKRLAWRDLLAIQKKIKP